MKSRRRLVVGVSGASGAILGVRLLEVLSQMDTMETHVVISDAAGLTIRAETGLSTNEVQALASYAYRPHDIGAAIASGSFPTDGMVVVPCTIKTLSAVAHCNAADLLARAADVTLKEGRPLLLVVREAPLHVGHLRLMLQAAEMGAIIFPAVPAFYTHPSSVDEMVDNMVGRILRRLGIDNDLFMTWEGCQERPQGSG